MLTQIQITNFTIIAKLDLELNAGMNVITGETGTGKSIIIDALELAMGGRANASQIRHGCNRCDITTHINIKQNKTALDWLNSEELDSDEDCILRRTITSEGRSKAYINGHIVPLQKLKNLASIIINVHGQHEPQNLLLAEQQRKLVDAYADNGDLLNELKIISQTIKQTEAEIFTIEQQTQAHQAEQQLLEFQIKELDELALEQNEYQAIESEHRKLAKADAIIDTLHEIASRCDGDDKALLPQINNTITALNSIRETDAELNTINELLNTALIQLQEAESEIQHYLQKFDRNPERLAWLENRLEKIHNLARKHHTESYKLYAFHQDIFQKLNSNLEQDKQVEKLKQIVDKDKTKYQEIAKKLSKSRKKATAKLSDSIKDTIQQLGMPDAKFEIQLLPHETDSFSLFGNEKIHFQVSANPGQPLQALSKVASGGEISRISLAIQVITARAYTTPCLVFDEVDVGIGGGTAETVGRLLRELSQNAQIICITHLAQVAALGHHHYRVEKQRSSNNTETDIVLLKNEEKISEIARMIGGLKITDQTLKHAREMLGTYTE